MIQILVLAANPHDQCPLDLEKEVQNINNVLQKSRFGNQFNINEKFAMTPSKLQESILETQPNIVHFSGHGKKNALIFEDDEHNTHKVSASALIKLFEIVTSDNEEIKCVILNACYSASQAEAISQYVPCVIGTTNEISDEAAIIFATSFYRALSYGLNIKKSFELGLNELEIEGIKQNVGSSIIKLLHSNKISPSDVFLLKNDHIPSEISAESDLENQILILLENPSHKGRDVMTVSSKLGIRKSKTIEIFKKLGAVRIVSEKDPSKANKEFWGIISHVIRKHFANSHLKYINRKYLLGNFAEKRDEDFRNKFDEVLNSVCVQSKKNEELWALR